MKKYCFLSVIILLSCNYAQSQWFPGYPYESINYYHVNAMNKQMLKIDSSLFLIKHGGLEEISTSDFTSHYKWLRFYPLTRIVADTSTSFVYLKSHDYIGKLNQNTGMYENILPEAYSNKYLYDIDVDPHGKIWAVSGGTLKEVGIWDGNEWQFFPYGISYFTGLVSG